MSKKEASMPKTKLSKREQLRAERRRRTLMWNSAVFGGGAIVLLGVVAYFIFNARPGPLPGEQVIPDEGSAHISSTDNRPPTYNHYPPSSGTHYGDQVAPWDVYTNQDPIPEGVFVHNLEHGGVVFLYQCPDSCPELEQQFRDLFEKAPPATPFTSVKVLATPYDPEKMPSPIVALAWGRQLDMQQFDEDLMLRWYRRFVNGGPEGSQVP